MITNCIVCGIAFKRAPRCASKTCSPPCQRARKQQRAAEQNARRPKLLKQPRPCLVCGNPFVRTQPAVVTCSPACRRERQAEQKKRDAARHRPRCRAATKRYYDKNKAACTARSMAWRRKHPDKNAEIMARYRDRVTAATSAMRNLAASPLKTKPETLEKLKRKRQENPEVVRAKERAKYQRNRERISEQNRQRGRRRRATLKAFKELQLI